jgi:hypothetical protein
MIGPQWITRKKRLRDYAIKHGIPVPSKFRITPTCGSACRELIKRVERQAWGEKAATGKWDGRLNQLIAPKLNHRQRALKLAKTQIGFKEHPAGSNRGPQIDQYTAVTGAVGQPWCASFQAWLFKQVGHKLDGGFNQAYVPSWVDAARAKRNGLVLVARSEVRPGDNVCFDWGRDGVADHIGIVSRVPDANGDFLAVEGNTSYGNDSNGGEVMERSRNVSQVIAFVRVV